MLKKRVEFTIVPVIVSEIWPWTKLWITVFPNIHKATIATFVLVHCVGSQLLKKKKTFLLLCWVSTSLQNTIQCVPSFLILYFVQCVNEGSIFNLVSI